MGAISYANLKLFVKRTVMMRTDLDAEIASCIHNAYLRLSATRGVNFRELDSGPHSFNTVDGTRVYSFDTILGAGLGRNVLAVMSLRDDTSAYRLRPHSVMWFDKLNQTTEGAPKWYDHFGTGIEMHPTPDAVYAMKMRIRKRPTALSADADVTLLPEEWDWPIVWTAGADVNALAGRLDVSAFYSSKAQDAIAALTTSDVESDQFEDFALAPDLTSTS